MFGNLGCQSRAIPISENNPIAADLQFYSRKFSSRSKEYRRTGGFDPGWEKE
jgi:hypothetical protein